MSTTADRLALLQRTKAGQRALLEEMYPDLDLSTVPFREYGRLFTGRKYVPGFVGGWKSYGRSNSEDASTRDILPDYSGNGRDIRLYNFSFSGMSGWGGYNHDFAEFIITVGDASNYIQGNIIHIGAHNNTVNVSYPVSPNQTVKIKVKVEGVSACVANGDIDYLNFYMNFGDSVTINKDGSYDINVTASDTGTRFYIYAQKRGVGSEWTPLSTPITIEQLPVYPGGLVSDGVDDYGQCIKNFALPDDYTVVAVRKMLISSDTAPFVAKSSSAGNGAFIMEYAKETSCYSYGAASKITNNVPILFSYQMKNRYNGITINKGSSIDSDSDILMLFRLREGVSSYNSYALYDLRIYDHSLSEEELETVRDEMMADYEKYTKPLHGIHYVCDFDAKGRSNDEAEPGRSVWTDKATGKVIDLHNYAYAGMSGWGGYGTDMSELVPHDDIAVTETAVTSLKCTSILQQSNSPIAEWGPNRIASGPTTVRFRVTGVSDNLGIRFESYAIGEGLKILFTATRDGVYTAEISDPAKYYRWIAVTQGTTVYPVNCDITIEQLPLYPGALVSDGVDDYGLTQEAINEEVGTIICHYKNLRVNPPETPSGRFSYIYEITNSMPDTDNGRMYLACTETNIMIMGEGGTYSSDEPLSSHLKIPKNYNNKMSLFSRVNTVAEIGFAAIYRLILIREQLDDEQVEFLKWKVEKEYRDWCKANGYEAINQLTA